MIYQSVISAVVRALAAETINSAGGCDFDAKVQQARIPGEISGKEGAFLVDCMVFGRLHSQLTSAKWDALVSKYSTHADRKREAVLRMAKAVQSPAGKRFIECAVVTWAYPKLPGAEGKRSTSVLPAGWYEMANWDDDGKPESTLRRWRGGIRRDLEREVSEALEAAQEILDIEELICSEAA
ncbi:hypothetical protein SAMN05216229_12328 [Geopseudomonas sagittaria]|uniref:Uncharacterized protein n=1 Tax=Geopseudomonas sagittaria TaxID=1135990 RepID=A0A1I5YPL5_9GAMM|nr:hypothetical protein [Pseudomonas sagittaria]SFQ46209.1 hypothetical protein SAMN05216229_12328 [Pseudomonas sagittaria]